MFRVLTGLTVGAVCGFAIGFVAQWVASPGAAKTMAVWPGAILATHGATAGAVVGAAADILAFLRKALPLHRAGPESDYGETTPRSDGP